MAAAAAVTAGRHDLAEMLADEVAASGEEGATIRAGAVYAAIRDCAADYPTASFDAVNSHPHSGWLDFALKGRKQKKRSVEVAFFREPSP